MERTVKRQTRLRWPGSREAEREHRKAVAALKPRQKPRKGKGKAKKRKRRKTLVRVDHGNGVVMDYNAEPSQATIRFVVSGQDKPLPSWPGWGRWDRTACPVERSNDGGD